MNPCKLTATFALTMAMFLPISGFGKDLTNKTKEPITFKGIPLDGSGVKNSLKEMCVANTSNNADNDKDACSFEMERTLIWASYGILGNSLCWITLSNSGALMKVEIGKSKQSILALAETLVEKYGKPTKKTEQVENGFGTKFDKEIFIWRDKQGAQITVESIYSKVDEGRIVIESAAAVAARIEAEKLLREAAKLNL